MEPIYDRIKSMIVQRIEDGDWPEGMKIPSENKLAAELNCSRMTVNRAMRELTSDGRLKRSQGRGTFVAESRPQAALFEVRDIAQEIRTAGGRHSCEILGLGQETAPPAIAQAMGKEPGAELFHAILLHRDQGRPVQHEDRWVNPDLAPGFLDWDLEIKTPAAFLLQKVPLSAHEHVVEAAAADRNVAETLNIKPGTPVLVLTRRTWSEDTMVTQVRFTYPGAAFKLAGRSRDDGRNGQRFA